MKPITLVTAVALGSLTQLAPAATEADQLRSRVAEQERTIQSLEKEIDSLHALLKKNNQSVPTIAAQTPKGSATYTVKKGDSLSKISRAHNVSLDELLAANKGFNPNQLRIGQTIQLPNNSVAKQSAAPKTPEVLPAVIPPAKQADNPKPAPNNTVNYVVKRGDTLYGIARKNGTSVANILEQNQGLNPNKLRVGQNIKLSSNSTSQAEAPKTPVAKKVDPTPAPKKQVAKAETKAPATKQVTHTPKQPRVRTVTVNRQMTFGEFASTYGASVDQINEMNGLRLTKSTVLAQGSELYIPNTQH